VVEGEDFQYTSKVEPREGTSLWVQTSFKPYARVQLRVDLEAKTYVPVWYLTVKWVKRTIKWEIFGRRIVIEYYEPVVYSELKWEEKTIISVHEGTDKKIYILDLGFKEDIGSLIGKYPPLGVAVESPKICIPPPSGLTGSAGVDLGVAGVRLSARVSPWIKFQIKTALESTLSAIGATVEGTGSYRISYDSYGRPYSVRVEIPAGSAGKNLNLVAEKFRYTIEPQLLYGISAGVALNAWVNVVGVVNWSDTWKSEWEIPNRDGWSVSLGRVSLDSGTRITDTTPILGRDALWFSPYGNLGRSSNTLGRLSLEKPILLRAPVVSGNWSSSGKVGDILETSASVNASAGLESQGRLRVSYPGAVRTGSQFDLMVGLSGDLPRVFGSLAAEVRLKLKALGQSLDLANVRFNTSTGRADAATYLMPLQPARTDAPKIGEVLGGLKSAGREIVENVWRMVRERLLVMLENSAEATENLLASLAENDWEILRSAPENIAPKELFDLLGGDYALRGLLENLRASILRMPAIDALENARIELLSIAENVIAEVDSHLSWLRSRWVEIVGENNRGRVENYLREVSENVAGVLRETFEAWVNRTIDILTDTLDMSWVEDLADNLEIVAGQLISGICERIEEIQEKIENTRTKILELSGGLAALENLVKSLEKLSEIQSLLDNVLADALSDYLTKFDEIARLVENIGLELENGIRGVSTKAQQAYATIRPLLRETEAALKAADYGKVANLVARIVEETRKVADHAQQVGSELKRSFNSKAAALMRMMENLVESKLNMEKISAALVERIPTSVRQFEACENLMREIAWEMAELVDLLSPTVQEIVENCRASLAEMSLTVENAVTAYLERIGSIRDELAREFERLGEDLQQAVGSVLENCLRPVLEAARDLFGIFDRPAEYSSDPDVVLLEHFNGSTLAVASGGNVTFVESMPGMGKAADFAGGGWLRYAVPGWDGYGPGQGTIDLWVKRRSPNAQMLVKLQWLSYCPPPEPGWGHIGDLWIREDGRLHWNVWDTGIPAPGEIHGNSVIPLYEWTHVAVVWSPSWTALYVNGELDAFVNNSVSPAMMSTLYIYVPGYPYQDGPVIDELRVSKTARTDFRVAISPVCLDNLLEAIRERIDSAVEATRQRLENICLKVADAVAESRRAILTEIERMTACADAVRNHNWASAAASFAENVVNYNVAHVRKLLADLLSSGKEIENISLEMMNEFHRVIAERAGPVMDSFGMYLSQVLAELGSRFARTVTEQISALSLNIRKFVNDALNAAMSSFENAPEYVRKVQDALSGLKSYADSVLSTIEGGWSTSLGDWRVKLSSGRISIGLGSICTINGSGELWLAGNGNLSVTGLDNFKFRGDLVGTIETTPIASAAYRLKLRGDLWITVTLLCVEVGVWIPVEIEQRVEANIVAKASSRVRADMSVGDSRTRIEWTGPEIKKVTAVAPAGAGAVRVTFENFVWVFDLDLVMRFRCNGALGNLYEQEVKLADLASGEIPLSSNEGREVLIFDIPVVG
jgi:hypothetical protein